MVDYFTPILYLSNTHKLHGPSLGVIYALVNGFSTLLHNIAPGKYIVTKVDYGLQMHFKIFPNKSDRKTTTTKQSLKYSRFWTLKYFHYDMISSIDDIIPKHVKIKDF